MIKKYIISLLIIGFTHSAIAQDNAKKVSGAANEQHASVEAAAKHFEQGMKHYQQGQYSAAIKSFSIASSIIILL